MRADSRVRPRLLRLLRLAGQIFLLAGLAWAGRRLVASGMLTTLVQASPHFIVGSFAAATGAHLMAAGRWWSLAPKGLGYVPLARIHVESHFWATLVPGGVAADGYRMLALHRRGANPHHAAASIMLERALGLVALLLLTGPALALGTHWLSSRLVISLSALASVLFAMIAGGTLAALWAPVRRGRLMWLPGKLRGACAGLEDAFAGYRNQPRRLVRALGFGLAYHALFLTAYALAGQAMGIHISPTAWFVAVPLASLVATLPVNAWGIGVREGAIVLLLVALGATPAQAGAASVVVVGLQLALGCSGGLSQLVRRNPSPATS